MVRGPCGIQNRTCPTRLPPRLSSPSAYSLLHNNSPETTIPPTSAIAPSSPPDSAAAPLPVLLADAAELVADVVLLPERDVLLVADEVGRVVPDAGEVALVVALVSDDVSVAVVVSVLVSVSVVESVAVAVSVVVSVADAVSEPVAVSVSVAETSAMSTKGEARGVCAC